MYESFPDYLDYLDEHKEDFPQNVYEFARDESRHMLNSPGSLHDAWITSIRIQENRNDKKPFEPKTEIEIVLLGPMHDRDFILKYYGVQKYRFIGNKNEYNWNDTFHGDILLHEVRLNDKGSAVHELQLVTESVIEITFKDLEFEEILHSQK